MLFVYSKAGGCEHYTCGACKTEFCRMCWALFYDSKKNKVKNEFQVNILIFDLLDMSTSWLFTKRYTSCSLYSKLFP
jgi:hypothetical protein